MDKRYDVVIAESGKIDIIKKKNIFLNLLNIVIMQKIIQVKFEKRQRSWKHFLMRIRRADFCIVDMRYIIIREPGIYYSL